MRILFTAFSVLSLASVATAQVAISKSERLSFTSDRIDVVTRGSGPDIILIPGLASHRDVWAAAAAKLVDRYRLHIVQVSGFGTAPRGNATGPVASPVAEEIARYIRETRLQRPAVIGHSMGGTIGMMLAARHPTLVGRLMVEDMMPFMGMMLGAPTVEAVRPMADQARDSMIAQHARGTPGMLEQMIPTMTRVDTMRSRLATYLRESHRPTVANAFHELITTDMRPELAKITAPTTVLYVIPGNLPLTPAQYEAGMRDAYANLRGARLVRVDESNHFIHFDQLDRFITEVDAFMRR